MAARPRMLLCKAVGGRYGTDFSRTRLHRLRVWISVPSRTPRLQKACCRSRIAWTPTAASRLPPGHADLPHRPQRRQCRRHRGLPLPGLHPLEEGRAIELTWTELGRPAGGHRRPGAAHLARPGDRVAVLAPAGPRLRRRILRRDQGGDHRGAVVRARIAGPCGTSGDGAPRCPSPSAVLTTTAARRAVRVSCRSSAVRQPPQVIVIDEIPDSAGDAVHARLRSTSTTSRICSTRRARPDRRSACEITHRAVGTNLMQMILAIDLLDRKVHGVSWLPLYHDMGLSMIGFPAVYGGHSTLMSPTAFIRRPQRWIQALSAGSRHGRVVTAAPNFAYEYTAQRGVPAPGDDIDLGNVVLIIGSEPVSIEAMTTFNNAFAPVRITAAPRSSPRTASPRRRCSSRPSHHAAEATVVHLDREQLAAGRAVRVAADAPNAVAHVSCGQVARSQWAVIVNPDTGTELPDGEVGEIWLHGDNVGRGYWGRPDETRLTFGATLQSRLSDRQPRGRHANRRQLAAHWRSWACISMASCTSPAASPIWCHRRPPPLSAGHRGHHRRGVADGAAGIRHGVHRAGHRLPDQLTPASTLVIVAERAPGTSRADPRRQSRPSEPRCRIATGSPSPTSDSLPAGAIPRTTSGKLARRACREQYLSGELGTH